MIATLVGALVLIGDAQSNPSPSVPRWSLRVEPARCLLERRNPEPPATLSIDTTPGSDSYRVAIASRDIKGSASFAPASLIFAPSQKVLQGFASIAKIPDGTPVIWMEGVPPSLLDDLAGAESVTIAKGSNVRGAAQVDSTAHAVEALRRCNADQLVEWGADAAQFGPGGKMPIALKDRDEWLSKSELLLMASQSKRSTISDDFRVTVGTDGVIKECHAIADVTEAGLEKMACAAVMNKRLFTPARDASGSPVRGVATFRINLISRPILM